MIALLISCEHAGNKIPKEYGEIFQVFKEVLGTHRGFDAGALDLARYLSKKLSCGYYYNEYSRLLVDANRSLNNRSLFSKITNVLDASEKRQIIEKYYSPHRERIYGFVSDSMMSRKHVLHIAVHSFVPVLDGKIRNADIGLLYDPSRVSELDFCEKFRIKLKNKFPDLRVRMNYPYRGTDDGLTDYLRKKHKRNYSGIEIEMNQGLLKRGKFPDELKRLMYDSLREILHND